MPAVHGVGSGQPVASELQHPTGCSECALGEGRRLHGRDCGADAQGVAAPGPQTRSRKLSLGRRGNRFLARASFGQIQTRGICRAADEIAAATVLGRFQLARFSRPSAPDCRCCAIRKSWPRATRRGVEFSSGTRGQSSGAGLSKLGKTFSHAGRSNPAVDHDRTRHWHRAVPRLPARARSSSAPTRR